MTFIYFMSISIGIAGAISVFFFRRGGIYNPILPPVDPLPEPQIAPVDASTDGGVVIPPKLLWDTPKQAFHSTRVLCDEMGLTYVEKNLICACIYQESQFIKTAVGKNAGSTDWGIVQVNDYWHIGKGKTFPSVDFVLQNPEECVMWMISMFKAGKLNLWVSYSSGAYKKWLSTTSPMWGLKG